MSTYANFIKMLINKARQQVLNEVESGILDNYTEVNRLQTKYAEMSHRWDNASKKIETLLAENKRLKKQLKKCICPNCGFGFKQALESKEVKDEEQRVYN